jgi:hypothetical protein
MPLFDLRAGYDSLHRELEGTASRYSSAPPAPVKPQAPKDEEPIDQLPDHVTEAISDPVANDDGLDIPPSLRRVERPKPRVVLTKAQQLLLDIRALAPRDCLQWGLRHHDAYEQLSDQEKQEIADALMARSATLNGSGRIVGGGR